MRDASITVVAVLSGIVILSACNRTETPVALTQVSAAPLSVVPGPQESSPTPEVRVETIKLAEIPTAELVAPGKITMNPNRISRVLPQVSGRVVKVMAALGDNVEQGQPVVEIESPDADAAVAAHLQAEATDRQARATLAKVEADLARTSDLYEHKAVAQKDLLAARNDFAQARAAVQTSEAALEQSRRKLEILGLKPTGFRQSFFVRAPISGKVLEVNVAPGEYRSAVSFHTDTTAPLMTIADLTTVWMSADVPESSIRLVHLGETVEIRLLAYPEERLAGRVARVADTLDPQTRTLKVHVDVANPRERFRPEMFGTVRYSGTPRRVPVVPASAIVQEYGRSVVFRERAPGEYERRTVTVAAPFGNAVPVLGGVQAGDRVVVDGAVLLKDR